MSIPETWITAAVAFASGIGVSLFGAVVANIFERRAERRRQREAARFDACMKLIELRGLYFWVCSAEVREQKPPAEVIPKIRDLAWRIADRLRESDEVEHLSEILTVLFDTGIPSASARYQMLVDLLPKLGKAVSPRYQHAIRAVSEANLQRALRGVDPSTTTTPGFMQ